MGSFNLIDDGWIEVLTDKKGTKKLVGLRNLFENADTYIDIAGDMHIQDFSIMRLILSIMHTVFSRYDYRGGVYEQIDVNEKMQQIEYVYEEDFEEYKEELRETWEKLWQGGKFPEIIGKYLDTWHDRFYLYDDKYPFYQFRKENVSLDKVKGKTIGLIAGKTIDRTITESENKVALFSPRSEGYKNKLTNDEIARWLITFQSYTGLSDKTIFGKEDYKMRKSKGWLYDLGAIFYKGDNLFKTLMLNFIILNPADLESSYKIQKPAWEFSDDYLMKKYLNYLPIDNLAELYTVYSRAIYIDPNRKEYDDFSMNLVKLPEVDHRDNFLEPMTVYRANDTGDYKDSFTPKKHPANQSMWRSFGLITKGKVKSFGKNKEYDIPIPGIINWLRDINDYTDDSKIIINSLSLEDDGNATSWVPVNEIYDSMPLSVDLLIDDGPCGWTSHIDELVETSKNVVSNIYGSFLRDIVKIRGLEKSGYVNNEIEKMYYLIDKPFRDMLESINKDDSKLEIKKNWENTLKKLVYNEAYQILKEASDRDYAVIEKDKSKLNIVMSFNKFSNFLNKVLGRRDSE